MKFSILTLVTLTTLAGITFATVNVHGMFYIFLRVATLLSVLIAILTAIYGGVSVRPFAVGWALCTGTILGLHFLRVNLVGIYLQFYFPDPGLASVVDVDLSLVSGYLGGCYAQFMHRRSGLIL